MYKQLTIICNNQIAKTVEQTLSRAGIQGFAHMQGTGTNVFTKSAFSQDLTWPADIFIVPTEEDLVKDIVDRLKQYAGQCREEPCLKLIVSPVEEFY